MKKSYFILPFLFVLAVIGLQSCKKYTPGKYNNIDDFIQKNGEKAQTFTLNSASGGTITTNKGWTFTFLPNDFVYESTLNAYNGVVKISVTEYNKISEIVQSGMTTDTYPEIPMKTGGMFRLVLTDESGSTKLATMNNISGFIPVTNPDAAMNIYRLFDDMEGTFTWGIDSSAIATVIPNTGSQPGYDLSFPSSYEFTNCDHPFTSNFCELTINLQNYNSSEARVYILVKSENAAVYLNPYSNHITYSYMPTGYEAVIVAVSVKDFELNAVFKDINVSSNSTVSLELAPMSDEDFKDKINSYNQ